MGTSPALLRLWLAIVLLLIPAGRRLEAGEPAPGFSLPGIAGDTVAWTRPAAPAAGGAAVPAVATLILFLDPAQEESLSALSDLRAFLERFGADAKRVRSLAIVPGKPEPAVVEALRGRLPRGGAVEGALDAERAAYGAYGVIALPTTFVVDGAGTIALVLPGRSAGYGRRLEAGVRVALGLAPAVDPAAAAADTPEARKALRLRKLGEDLAAEKKWAEAAKQFEAARAARPDDPDLALLHGNALVDLGDGAGAEAAFRRALELAPDSRAAKAGIAIAVSLRDPEAGEKALRDVTHVPNPSPAAFYHLGLLLERKGDFQGAAESFRQAYERQRHRK